MKYNWGEWDQNCSDNRQITLRFNCDAETLIDITSDDVIDRFDDGCEIVIEMYTLYGCPIECVSDGKLCSNHDPCMT